MNFRRATSDDVTQLLEWMDDFNRLEGIAWSSERGEPAVRRLLGDSSLGLVGIFEAETGDVGYFVVTWGYDLEWNGRDAFLTEFYLAPSQRGRHLGKWGLAIVEQVAKEHEVRALHLMVRPENVVAKRLYERAGYAEPGRLFFTKPLQ